MLLILAGVTITFVLGDGGIIDKAQEAADKTKNAVDKENEDFEKLNSLLSEYGGGDPQDPADEPVTKNAIAKEYGVKQTGENKTITESNTESGTNKSITIPQGYTVLEPTEDNTVKYADNNNPKIDEGIVIKDDDGNEFVWVPVKEINDMVMCQTHPDGKITFDEETETFSCNGGTGGQTHQNPLLAGKLYEDSGSFNAAKSAWTYNANSGYREPAIVTGGDDGNGSGYDAVGSNYSGIIETDASNLKDELEKRFNEMAKSVAKYKGFYIGRYETSGLKTTETPEVKPGKPTVSTTWYTMYKNSKKIAQESSGATSSMIWGSQWDATMKWFISCGGTAQTYVTNSSGMGWYSGVSGNESHKTGEPLQGDNGEIKNRVNNIYDMAGNMYEWTIEASGTIRRVRRGCGYDSSGSSHPASGRTGSYPDVFGTYGYLSSRAV